MPRAKSESTAQERQAKQDAAARGDVNRAPLDVHVQKDYEDYNMAVTRLADISIEAPVYMVRGQKVMLEADVARLYEVETQTLLRAVQRNRRHFPVDFLFKLTAEEFKSLRAQPDAETDYKRKRSTPYVFTEAGVAMVSQILHSARALQVNVAIIRDFVRLRKLCGSNLELADKMDAIDAKYDQQVKRILTAIEALQSQLKPPPDRRVGFYVP